MMTRHSRGTVFLLFAIAASAVLFTACAPRAAGRSIDDVTITTRVKTVLLNSPDVPGHEIDVQTSQGVVTLSGRVRNSEEQQRALDLAQRVDGVRNVQSKLQIVPDR
jgi:osmotically-inducible protein OsmY